MEARRSARVATKFLVAIEGLEQRLVARTGDVSATGIYFETTEHVGEVGTVQWLHLASADRARAVHVMAHVVRTVTLTDIGGARTAGVALEFMPESDEAAATLQEFVRYTLALVHDGAVPQIASRLEARATAGGAVVRQLSVRSMTLETNWSVAPGERVRVDIVAPGMTRRIRLDGRAMQVVPGGGPANAPRYRIEVQVHEETERPLRHQSSLTFPAVRPDAATIEAMIAAEKATPAMPPSAQGLLPEDDDISDTLDNLLSALIRPPAATPPSRPKREHLSGLLSRIRLATLCSLFDMERLSGELTLRHEDERVVIYVRDGQLVDVSPMADNSTARQEIARMLAWEDGAFEFSVLPVQRANRVGVSTTALLLDLAREADEERPR